MEAGGFRFLDWQRIVVGSWLGVDAYGRWAAKSCGEHVPRQNGKTLGTTEPRMNWGAFALNELVLYTSHLQKTSTETFEDMASFFDQRKFHKYLKAIRTALGREAIEFRAGGKIKFLARTRNGGRGQHADLLVFDEDQELTDEQQASFMPCLSASSNPQILYTGTPPDESAPGMVARRIRDRALSGAEGIAYAEWSVPEVGDINDRERWYETNPSLGVLILESTIEAEALDMAPDKFARERLGWWSPTEGNVEHVIDAEAWALFEGYGVRLRGGPLGGGENGAEYSESETALYPGRGPRVRAQGRGGVGKGQASEARHARDVPRPAGHASERGRP